MSMKLFSRLSRRVGALLVVSLLVLCSAPASPAALTSYFSNKLIDQVFRAQAFTFPSTTLAIGLLVSTNGARANSTAYALNNTVSVTAADGANHLYKSGGSCTSAASQPTYPGSVNEAITDGTCTFTEQTAALRAGTATEASYTGYARATVAASLANWAGTQSAGSTVASAGTGQPLTSNNATVTIGAAATSGPSYVWSFAVYDASSAGNMLMFVPLTTVRTIASGDGAPSFAAGQAQIFLDK